MELATIADIERAFLRLVGTVEDDDGLTERGETEGDVVSLCLTRGFRAAQRYMLEQGYVGWQKRSDAITWMGSDSADGGRYVSLTTLADDFLRAYGDEKNSCLTEANGDRWGRQVRPDERALFSGNGFYFTGDRLWLLRQAQPPATLYLDYHYKHPPFDDELTDETIDFPMDARMLGVAFAADFGKDEEWFTGDRDDAAKIDAALEKAKREARDLARPTKQQRKLRKPPRFGNRW